jgi:hypothetical protein
MNMNDVQAEIVSITNNEVIFRIKLEDYPELRDETKVGPMLDEFLTSGDYPNLREVQYLLRGDYLFIMARGIVNPVTFTTAHQEN